MKKILFNGLPKIISLGILCLIFVFFRYYLEVNTKQFAEEFKNQNYKELYSIDTFKISSKLNSLSASINWVCIKGSYGPHETIFYHTEKNNCENNLWQKKETIEIAEADNLKISFTLRLPKSIEQLFVFFLFFQSLMTLLLFFSIKKSEQQKIENDYKLFNLSKQMFHDIRSPLAALTTLSESIKLNDHQNEKIFKLSIERIQKIANSLLDQSRTLQSENLNPIPLLTKILDLKKAEYPSAEIVFENKISSTIFLQINPIELERIISNLINNSIEAVEKITPKINLNVSIQQNNFILTITDNGKGISKDVLLNLGKKSITTKSKGNGLGLTHAKEKITEWSGTLSFDTEYLHGSKLLISIPISSEEKKHIILLDNDELTRMNWEFKAKKAKINLITFKNEIELFNSINTIEKSATFYIDSELDNTKGEDIALKLHQMGYSNLYMATGYAGSKFAHLSFILGTIDKSPPF